MGREVVDGEGVIVEVGAAVDMFLVDIFAVGGGGGGGGGSMGKVTKVKVGGQRNTIYYAISNELFSIPVSFMSNA